MRIMPIAGLLLVAALAVVAPMTLFATEEGTPTPAPAVEFTPSTTELIDAGAEPRAPLRYRFNKDLKELMVMDMTISMGMEVGGMEQPANEMPTIRMFVALEGQEITEEGNLKYGMEFTKIDVLGDEDSDPAMIDALESAMVGVVGLTGWGIVDDRGVTKDVGFTIPEDANPAVVAQLDQMRGQLNQLAAPLPEDAVGIGAKWRVTQHIESSGMSLTQEGTYTLEERLGESVKLSLTLTQKALPQNIQPPNLPAGTTVKLTFLESQGSGRIDLDMARFVPSTEMSMKMKMNMEISIAAPDMPAQTMPMGMKMKIEMKIRPGAITETEAPVEEEPGESDD